MVCAIHLGASCTVPFCIVEPIAQPPSHVNKGIGYAHPVFYHAARSGLHGSWIPLIHNHAPPIESSSHPRIPPAWPLPPPDADQPTLTQIDWHNSGRQHIRSLPPHVEADRTGGQSKFSLLPPVPVPHPRSTPPALSRTSITFSGRRSVNAPVPLSDNALPQRTSLLHPPWRTSVLPTAAGADNRHTSRYSLLPHVHVGLSPGVVPSASPQPSNVPVKRDGQYRSRWSLLPKMPTAKYRKTM